MGVYYWVCDDVRSTVTFPAAEHRRPLASTKLYCLVTETQSCVCVCACVWSRCVIDELNQLNPRSFHHESDVLTITPPRRAQRKNQRFPAASHCQTDRQQASKHISAGRLMVAGQDFMDVGVRSSASQLLAHPVTRIKRRRWREVAV